MIVALVMVWFFVSNTVVYNYSFSRLLFVSGLEQRMPTALGRVNERKVPVAAVVTQTVLVVAVRRRRLQPVGAATTTRRRRTGCSRPP